MELDDPEIQMLEQIEEERLQRGVIDWAYVLSPILKRIEASQRFLFYGPSLPYHQQLIDDGVIIGPDMTKEQWEEADKKVKERDESQLSKARKELDQVIALLRDTERISKIECLSKKIVQWTDKSRDAPCWEEVAGCLLKFPGSVEFESGICPKCGESTFDCHFATAEYLRAMNVGFGGEMTICPHCHYLDFRRSWII